jgi:dTDP-4-dehydrorhamnose reductase
LSLKILVAGATGFLGTSLVKSLKIAGHEVVEASLTASNSVDFSEFHDCQQFVMSVCPQIIINLIANTNVDDCESNFESARKLNCIIPSNLAFCATLLDSLLIHISSDQVYSKPGSNTETEIFPVNAYGRTKLDGERYVLSWEKSVVLRTNFVGKSLSTTRHSLTDWVYDQIKQDSLLYLYNDIFFNPVHIDFLCEVIERICRAPIYGVFNVGSDRGLSKASFCQSFINEMKFSDAKVEIGPYSRADNSALRPNHMIMSTNKFFGSYGILPQPMEQVLGSCVSEYKVGV